MAAEDRRERLPAAAMLDVGVRFWAELGRARVPVARAISLPPGAILDLDREADDPIDVYVNGLHFGTARLVIEDGEWAIRMEAVGDPGELLGSALREAA